MYMFPSRCTEARVLYTDGRGLGLQHGAGMALSFVDVVFLSYERASNIKYYGLKSRN